MIRGVQALLDALPEPHLVVAFDGRVLACNEAARRALFGDEDGVGRPLGDALVSADPHLAASLRACARSAAPILVPVGSGRRKGPDRGFEGLRLEVDGEVHILLRAAARQATTRRLARTGVALRVQRRQRREFERLAGALAEVADTDPLTDVGSRRALERELATRVAEARRRGEPLSVAMVDVDHFKRFNDVLGHPAGDEVLVAVAGAIDDALRRPADFVGRFGGEEFLCVLPDTDAVGARHCAAAVRSAVEALELEHPDSPVGPWVTVSIGVATGHGAQLSAEVLVEAADAALYRSKSGGRARVCVAPAGGPVGAG